MLIGTINGQEKYSNILEPNLYGNAVFQPGVSYNADYEQADAIAAKVYKVSEGVYADPSTGVSDYNSVAAADTLITLPYNNLFQESKKFYTVQGQVVPYEMGVKNMEVCVEKIRVRKDTCGLACAAKEFTAYTGSAITAANVEDELLALKQLVADANGTADIAIVSNRVYGAIIKAAGAAFDTDVKNFVMAEGQVGRWLGLTIIPTSLFQKTVAKYYDKNGTLQTVDFTDIDGQGAACELVVYDHRALSILGKATDAGIYDGHPTFNGSAAQAEVYGGFAVTNASLGRVHQA